MYRFKPELTSEALLREIMQLDADIYDFHESLHWYTERYLSKSLCVTMRDNKDILSGYLTAVGINENLYNAFVKGIIQTDEMIHPNCFVPIKDADAIYLASIVVIEGARSHGFATMMNKILLAELDYMELTDKRMIALTSAQSFHLLRREGFDAAFMGKYIVATKN